MYNSSASEVTTLWRYTNLFIIIIITLSYLAIFGVHDKTRQLRATRRYSLQMLLGRNLHANDALRYRSLHNDRDRKFLAKPKLQLSLRPLARPTPPFCSSTPHHSRINLTTVLASIGSYSQVPNHLAQNFAPLISMLWWRSARHVISMQILCSVNHNACHH